MTASRIRIGLVIGFLGLALSTGTAAAQVEGCGFSVCPDQQPEVIDRTDGDQLGEGEERTDGAPGEGEVAPDEAVSPQERAVGAPAQAAAPSGTLPFTGNDVFGLTAIGVVALGGGVLLVRRSRANA